MKKCVVCGKNTQMFNHLIKTPQNVARVLANDIDPYQEWQNCDDNIIIHQEQAIPVICELCWIAMMWNGWDYVWNGEKLLVHDESEGEYVEFSGDEYEPSRPVSIKFVYDEYHKEWVVEPR